MEEGQSIFGMVVAVRDPRGMFYGHNDGKEQDADVGEANQKVMHAGKRLLWRGIARSVPFVWMQENCLQAGHAAAIYLSAFRIW